MLTQVSVILSVSEGKCRRSTSNYTMTAFFRTISHSLFTKHSTILRHKAGSIASVVDKYS